MSKIYYVSDFQRKVIFSEEQFNLVLHSAGGGTTFALMLAAHEWCEKNPDKYVTFFCGQNSAGVLASGGVFDKAKSIYSELGYKCSEKSLVFTNKNGSKIKLQYSRNLPVEHTYGLSRDFIIFDVRCPSDLIIKHFPRANKIIVADYLEDMKEEISWCKRLRLFDGEGFSPLVNVIKSTGVESNSYMMQNDPKYAYFLSMLPKEELKRLTNTEL